MTVALPVSQDRISPVLDTAMRLVVVTCRRGRETGRREIALSPLPTESLADSVAELHVDVLLCGALSEALHRALQRHGVRVRPHLCGPVEAVLNAFCCGQLDRDEFRMPGCWKPHSRGEREGALTRSRSRKSDARKQRSATTSHR